MYIAALVESQECVKFRAERLQSLVFEGRRSARVNENQDTSRHPASCREWLPRRRELDDFRPRTGFPPTAAPSAQLISANIDEIENSKNMEPLPCMRCHSPHKASPSRVCSRCLGRALVFPQRVGRDRAPCMPGCQAATWPMSIPSPPEQRDCPVQTAAANFAQGSIGPRKRTTSII